jgi:predicted alpha-1,2-mannosidase
MVSKDSTMTMPEPTGSAKAAFLICADNLRLKSEAIHMKKLLLAVFTALLATNLSASAQTRDFARHVNPFIGTGGHGHTFPGATVPFGMVQLSPDTRIDNWDGSSGYHYSDSTIQGFSHTHLNGTGIPDGCDILFMPTTGEPGMFLSLLGGPGPDWYTSTFSHANETAEPGYYSVKLDKSDVTAELTARTRVGLHRYTFPKKEIGNIVLDLEWRDKLLGSEINTPTPTRIEGYRRSSSWAKDHAVYFVAEFSKPYFRDIQQGRSDTQKNTANSQRIFRFDVRAGEQILLKVAISHVSLEGARKNLEAELPGWDFDKVRADARAAWNKELSKIEVSGGTPEQTTNFYTALYHTMIQPNVFNDVDGRYKGLDGKIHHLPSGSSQYTVFSLWDTFRAAHPLYTIIDQKRTVDFINTFIRQYEQGGRLPVWELWGEETDTMIGYHAVSVIADAMAKNLQGFDYEKAYAAAKHSAELDHFGLAAYKKRGYISMEDENESVSRTLEYAYNDWCLMQIASGLFNRRSLSGKKITAEDDAYLKALSADIDRYRRRSMHFENLFDPKTGFFRPKKNGGFVEPFAPNEVTFGFTEGNSWQYSFFVPHNVSRLMELMGGQAKFEAKLDELFTTDQKLAGREQADLTGLIGQYAHGNEPSHHIAYLYNYVGAPSKTQRYVRRIMDEFYKPTPDGLIGNEDCGQMSAWYILSASGFYPVAPGETRYDLGTPLFREITYKLENGKKFTVRARNVSPTNIYVASVKWNGERQANPYIVQEQIMAGGVLEFEMTERPNDKAFEYPTSRSVFRDRPAVPVIEGDCTFDGSATVAISSADRRARFSYTLETSGAAPKTYPYAGPFKIDSTTRVTSVAIDAAGAESYRTEALFQKRPNDWSVRIVSPYSSQYTGGGDNAIIDGIRGTTNFASGEWQGVQGKTYEAIIDLKRETEIRTLGASFLQVAGPWIWMPDRIEFEVSSDGTNFRKAVEIKPEFPQREMTPTMREFTKSIDPVRARYVRLKAYNFGKIPSWHLGAGGDPWIFIDEVIIK